MELLDIGRYPVNNVEFRYALISYNIVLDITSMYMYQKLNGICWVGGREKGGMAESPKED
jgi:hypothetical protein